MDILKIELYQLETETFEIEECVGTGVNALDAIAPLPTDPTLAATTSSSSCSCSSCCSCSTSSCCATSSSSCSSTSSCN